MTGRNDIVSGTVTSVLKLLQLRPVQVSVCMLSIIVTLVIYANINVQPIYSFITTATKTDEKNTMYSWKKIFVGDNQFVYSNISSTKIILSYEPNRWLDEWVGRDWNTTNVFRTCPVSNCVLTQDREMLNVADAVLYRWDSLGTCRTKLKQGQVWILFEHESPDYFHKPFKKCNNKLVNWTLTYRRDSDFTMVYGQFAQHDTGYNVSNMYPLLRSKSKTAVGFISHCRAPSKRDEFVRQLRSYGVHIDIYGKCGNLTCGGDKDTKWKGVWNMTSGHKDKCFDVLDSQYKFYLSLENSLCKDYVTEKSLHLVLRHQIVPIIRDGAIRSLYHPPHSYVDTKDFKSIKSLAKYIKFLSENFDEYLKFFNWRKYYTVRTISGVLQSIFCDMCNRMHHQQRYKRLYKNVKQFYKNSHGKNTNKHTCSNRLI